MTSFRLSTIANIPSGTCAVAATMDMNQPGQGHIYVASNTQAGVVNVADAGTNYVMPVSRSVCARWEPG